MSELLPYVAVAIIALIITAYFGYSVTIGLIIAMILQSLGITF